MKTLCIDTSGEATMVLIEAGDETARAVQTNQRRHAESLLVLLGDVLGDQAAADSGIDRIIVGTGPGPFTGLRSGLAFAATLARGLGVPVFGVSSQEALARQALDANPDAESVLVSSNAKRNEIYWGIYRPSGDDDVLAEDGPNVGPVTEAETKVQARPELVEFSATVDPAIFERIVDHRLASDPDATFPLSPLYLRSPDVHVKVDVPNK